jgi:hypothetical protein
MGGLRFLTSYYSQNNGFQLDIVGKCLFALRESATLWTS